MKSSTELSQTTSVIPFGQFSQPIRFRLAAIAEVFDIDSRSTQRDETEVLGFKVHQFDDVSSELNGQIIVLLAHAEGIVDENGDISSFEANGLVFAFAGMHADTVSLDVTGETLTARPSWLFARPNEGRAFAGSFAAACKDVEERVFAGSTK